MPPRRRSRKDLTYISKFTYPNVGEFEIDYNKVHAHFQTWIDEELITAPTEAEVKKLAHAFLERTTKLDWKPFIVINTSAVGSASRHDNWGDGPMREEHSFTLHFFRTEIAQSLDPRKGRIWRRHPEDKGELWSEWEEKRWGNGTASRSVHADEDHIFLDYDPAIWDTLMRMAAVMAKQREALQKLLSSKQLRKLLLAQRKALPALPAPKRKR